MIQSGSQTLDANLSSLTLNGVTTYGIKTTLVGTHFDHLITNGAMYTKALALEQDTTALELRVTSLETNVDQDVKTTAAPSFEGLGLTKGDFRGTTILSTSSTRTWYELTNLIPNDGFGKYACITIIGKTGLVFDPIHIIYHITRTPSVSGGILHMNYESTDPNFLTSPQFIVYFNPIDASERLYIRPEFSSSYQVMGGGNQYMYLNIEDRGIGTIPDNIDLTWTVYLDTDAGLPGPRINLPNTSKQLGKLYLTNTALAPDYALETYGVSYFGGNIVSNAILTTNDLRPGGFSSITKYQANTGTVNVTGALVTTTAYRYTILNDQITLRLIGVTGTSVATSPIIITLPTILDTSIQSTTVINITDGPTADIGTAIINGTTINIYRDGNGTSFQVGVTAAFSTFTMIYFLT